MDSICEGPAGESAMIIGRTESVCPICLQRIPGEKVVRGDEVHLVKRCPRHGLFRAVIWRGPPSYAAWAADAAPAPLAAEADNCPNECGLCPQHRQASCCVLLEVIPRCNLACPVCFARAGDRVPDPPAAQLVERMTRLSALPRKVNLQFSGGEPTVRDDLPGLIGQARRLGFPFLQLNTNGLRLARQPGYAEQLASAGLDCVFLQFDGVTDQPYRIIRGRDLLEVKEEAIRRCGNAGLGVVLVPTLVPGVNTAEIGDIVRTAVERMPVVRAVHFQPISYFGRYPGPPGDAERFTLPEVLRALETQTGGAVRAADFKPASAENPYCSFSARFLVTPEREIERGAELPSCCCPPPAPADRAEQARRFVARHWVARQESSCCGTSPPADSFEAFLAAQQNSLCISGMVFQDAWTLELDRLRQCHVHIAGEDHDLIPLCAYNLSALDGSTLYRGETGRR